MTAQTMLFRAFTSDDYMQFSDMFKDTSAKGVRAQHSLKKKSILDEVFFPVREYTFQKWTMKWALTCIKNPLASKV